MGFIAYPPSKHSTDSEQIFFIGSAENFCKINAKSVELFDNGNFAPIFELVMGLNHFNLELDGEKQEFLIERTAALSKREHCFQELKSKDSQLNFKKICIDPGHGGSQLGTCSPKGVYEKDLNLDIALRLNLENDFVLTRSSDIDISLQQRVQIAEDANCDFFVSIHHNAIPDYLNPLEHQGVSVHYYYDEYLALAENCSSFLSQALGLYNNGAIKQNLHVLRENKSIPALLFELGYLIHPLESELISSEKHINLLVKTLKELFKSLGSH